MGAEFIRALEHHRAHTLGHIAPGPAALSERLLVSWIHHDNMLEGELYAPMEIRQALRDEDGALDRYLHPLMQRIRRYRDTVLWLLAEAQKGPSAVTIDNLKSIHRRLTPDAADRPGMYRQNSPVHRDYYQRICSADKVTYTLRKIFEQIQLEGEDAADPVCFAAEIHHKLMHAYPFRRNPGTTARLFTNLLLLSRGYPPALIPAQLRSEYYEALCDPEPAALARIYRAVVQGFLVEGADARRQGPQIGLS